MSMANGPTPIGLLLRTDDQLRQLRSHARTWRPPQPLRDSGLPPAVADRTTVLFDDGLLILMAENNAVAQVLQFHGPRLAQQLGASEWRIRVSRAPDLNPSQRDRPAPPPRHLPATAARILEDTAAAISDPGLRSALLKLASVAKDP